MSPEQSPKSERDKKDKLPLTDTHLDLLVASTVDNLRDRALILIILAGRPTTDEIKDMRKSDLKTNTNGQTTLTFPDREVRLPQQIADVLNRYKETVNTTTLFPSWPKKHDSPGISRQTVDNIIKRHCNWAKLGRRASHGVLIDTANIILKNK